MRKECEKRSLSEVGIVDRVNDLGVMVRAVAPELFCEGCEGFKVKVLILVLLIERQSQENAKVH